jgi:hypothetical protein
MAGGVPSRPRATGRAILPPALQAWLRWSISSVKPGSRSRAIATATLLLVTLLAQVRFLGTGFAASDTLPLIETSRLNTPGDAAALFTQPVMAGTRFALSEIVYRPFVSVTFGLDYAAWALNAVGYHLTNLVLHLAGVAAVLFLLRRLGLGYWSSLAGAALFALHPVVVASVPVIARRDSVLPVTAFVAGAGLFLAADQSRGAARIACLCGALVLVGIALVSKESAFAALLMLPVLLLCSRVGRSGGLRQTLLSFRLLIPFVVLAAALFGVRWLVLRGFGGGPESDLLPVDLEKYSQTLGAYTRDLAWPFAWVASSTREIWPRLAGLCLLGLLVTLVWLPPRQAAVAATGTLWVVGFALFSMVLKIATIAWLAYFALVGVALLFAAGLEGALVRLGTPTLAGGWPARVPKVLSGGLLIGLGLYGVTALSASSLVRDYYQWQVAGDVTQRYMQALDACLAAAPQATHVDLQMLPSSFDDGQVDTNLMGVTLLEDYTVESALRLSLPQRPITVHASSYGTLRAGADTLKFTCEPLPPDGIRLTTSY